MKLGNLKLFLVISLLLTSVMTRSSFAFIHHIMDQDEVASLVKATSSKNNPSNGPALSQIKSSLQESLPTNSSAEPTSKTSDHCVVHCGGVVIGFAPQRSSLIPPHAFEHKLKPEACSFESRSQMPDLRPPIVIG